jgi:hypothetical protein
MFQLARLWGMDDTNGPKINLTCFRKREKQLLKNERRTKWLNVYGKIYLR